MRYLITASADTRKMLDQVQALLPAGLRDPAGVCELVLVLAGG